MHLINDEPVWASFMNFDFQWSNSYALSQINPYSTTFIEASYGNEVVLIHFPQQHFCIFIQYVMLMFGVTSTNNNTLNTST